MEIISNDPKLKDIIEEIAAYSGIPVWKIEELIEGIRRPIITEVEIKSLAFELRSKPEPVIYREKDKIPVPERYKRNRFSR